MVALNGTQTSVLRGPTPRRGTRHSAARDIIAERN